MANKKNECIDTARKALNLFTGDELEEYIKQVQSETINLRKQNVPFPREAAIKNINNEFLASMLEDSARSARDIGKWEIKKPKLDSGVRTKSFLDKTSKNTDDNIETAGNAVKQLLHDDGFGNLEKEHLDILLDQDGKADDDIAAIADGQEHSDARLKKIADAFNAYIPKRNARLIQSDAMRVSELHRDRYFRNNYDRSKMLNIGREAWIEMHKSRIDIEETFRNSRAMNIEGHIDDSIVNEMIGNTFDNIIEGNGTLFTKAAVSRDSDAIERTRHMFYIYKDFRSWTASNKEYGQGTIMKAWLSDINTSSKQIGMAQIMGTQPKKMWLEMRHYQVKKSPPTTAQKVEMDISDALFNNLLGANKGAYDPTVANIGASIRALSSAARLAKVVLTSIPDIANIGGIAMRSGNGYWGPAFDALIHSFNLLPSESRKIIARQMSASLDTQMGTVSRYVETSGIGNTIDKLSNKFYWLNFLDSWDKGNKLSAMVPIMKGFGRASKQTFEKLNNQRQAYLRRFNINEVEWDALRSKTEKGYFSLDNVNNMTETELKELWNKTDKAVPLSDYRSSLYRKVYSMFDTAQEFSVLNPTAFSNMMTTLNSRSGTVPGEIVRGIGQFKGFAIQYIRRIMVGGMQDFDSYQSKFMYGMNMAIATIMLTQLSDTLKALANGLTPPNPSQMSRSEQRKYYGKMLLGGAGIFGSILNNNEGIKSAVLTPSIKLALDPIRVAFNVATGDLKTAKSLAKEWANVANPLATFPIGQQVSDKILGNKPYLEPSQHPLF